MSEVEITARLGTDDDAPSATVTYDFGTDLESAVELFGADVVYTRFKAAVTIDIQALVRRNLGGENPKTEEEIQQIVNEWRPGVSNRRRKSATEKAAEAFDSLSDADKQALLEKLMAAG
jgi:hypothetical protein